MPTVSTRAIIVALLALTAACTTRGESAADTTAAAGSSAPAMAPGMDHDQRPAGATGVPAGYQGRTDRENANIADAQYTVSGNEWEVRTGPAHIVYAAGDTASGRYTARARIAQLAAPTHPEAYGIFIGGKDLDQPTQRYTYFIVRGTGEYMVKVRDGGGTRTIADWTASPDVPKADGAGAATYELAAQVLADSVRFTVNGKTVATVARSSTVPTDGVAGLRINHNLHVRVQPVAITRG